MFLDGQIFLRRIVIFTNNFFIIQLFILQVGALTYERTSHSRDVSFLSATPLPSSMQIPGQQYDTTIVEPTINQTSQIDKEFTEINHQFSQLSLQYQQPDVQNIQGQQQPQSSYYGGEMQNDNSLQTEYVQGSEQQVQQLVSDPNSSYGQQSSGYDTKDSGNQYVQYGQDQQQVEQNNGYPGGGYQYQGYDQNQSSLGYESMQQSQAPNSYDYWAQQNSTGANDEVSGV